MAREKFFHKNVKYLRKSSHLTQSELAERVNCGGASTISKWESFGIVPPEDMLNKLSEMFHVSIDDLLYKDLLTEAREAIEQSMKNGTRYSIPNGMFPEIDYEIGAAGEKVNVELTPVEAFALTRQEQRLIAYYRIMSQAQQESFVSMAKSMVEK